MMGLQKYKDHTPEVIHRRMKIKNMYWSVCPYCGDPLPKLREALQETYEQDKQLAEFAKEKIDELWKEQSNAKP